MATEGRRCSICHEWKPVELDGWWTNERKRTAICPACNAKYERELKRVRGRRQEAPVD